MTTTPCDGRGYAAPVRPPDQRQPATAEGGRRGGGGAADVVLIGLRASGKSTVGRLLGAALGREFVDLDDVTPRLLGSDDVRGAWSAHGEAGFRAAEARALAQELSGAGRVLALGGGTPEAPGAAAMLRDARDAGRAVVVYLRADAAVLRERLRQADNANRPSLTGAGLLDEIEDVLARRDGAYSALADLVVEHEDAPNAEDAAGRIVRWLGEGG